MSILKFKALRDISVGVHFQEIEDNIRDTDAYRYEVYAATPLFGYNSKGKLSEHEKFMFLGEGSLQVEEMEDATMLCHGSIFCNDDEIVYTVILEDNAFFKKEFIAFSSFITNDLENMFKEIITKTEEYLITDEN